MVRTEKYKLIHYPHIGKTQLFDLENDPLEMKDLYANSEMKEIKEDLIKRLKKQQKIIGDPMKLNL
jgi:arylsulfatase A-like enzyme